MFSRTSACVQAAPMKLGGVPFQDSNAIKMEGLSELVGMLG
jgi:hypothetical protein